MAVPRIRSMNSEYRGFLLGCMETSYGYKAAWKSSLDKDWRISKEIADSNTPEDVKLLAHDCIDRQYRMEAAQIEREMCKP